MIERLPAAFMERMTAMLGQEAEAFFASYRETRTHGLRLNPLKLAPDGEEGDRLKRLFGLTPVPWCGTGYYYGEDVRPGKHPYHAAGLYYIQEPSAMSAVEILRPKPGDTVLDLAAAPGGKTTQIAGWLKGEGLLVANEIHGGRAAILSENVERLGIANTIVLNEEPDRLAARFPAFFDKIMLDAPCSGEGMFRKDPEAISEWSESHVAMCAARQLDILEAAVRMLRPGGLLAYSTCTFNREENEQTIEAVLSRHPSLLLESVERIWPHRDRGEGHFVALLRLHEDSEASGGNTLSADGTSQTGEFVSGGKLRRKPANGTASSREQRAAAEAWRAFEAVRSDWANELALPEGEPMLFGQRLFWLPHDERGRFSAAALLGLRAPRPGLHVADLRKDRLEPAHALAMALPYDTSGAVSLSADSPETAAYLRGETIPAPSGIKGWTVVRVDGYPLGWGKASDGTIKNHLPKGLRRLT